MGISQFLQNSEYTIYIQFSIKRTWLRERIREHLSRLKEFRDKRSKQKKHAHCKIRSA